MDQNGFFAYSHNRREQILVAEMLLAEQSIKMGRSVRDMALLYGNKSANLIALNDIIPGSVPDFLPLNSNFIYNHLKQYSGNKWSDLLAKFQTTQGEEKTHILPEALQILEQLRNEIITTFQNHPIEDKDLQRFLDAQTGHTLMVRSTGEEDTVDLANPGGNESIAAVTPTIAAVSVAIGRVVASYFSEKSLRQRLLSPDNNITKEAFVPVLIQQMIGEPRNGFDNPDKVIRSGVMYTGKSFTRIQVAPGHGELVVNSQGLFDTFSVTRENMVYPEIRTKKYRLVPSYDGLQLKENPKSLQQDVSISIEVAQQLTEMGRKIEANYGMPMDVEFVYNPEDKKISIVQARPIPTGKDKTIIPTSIPPDKMSDLKQHLHDGKIDKQDAQVITAAGFRAQIITDPKEILVCNNISDALNFYLKQSAPSPIKAVVVQHLSPPNSHEAAQFNLMGIPVLQINNLAAIKEWSAEKPLMMVDPQRSQILNLKLFMPESTQPENELKTHGFLAEGLFTHPVKPISIVPLSIQPNAPIDSTSSPVRLVDAIQTNSTQTFKTMFSKIKNQSLDKNNMYTQLLTNIETLEAAPNNETARALSQIRYAISKIAQNFQQQINFFPQIMIVCEEIERSTERLVDNSTPSLRDEHLALIAQLKSLVSFPGVRDTFSNSIKQVMQEEKSAQLVTTTGLDNEQVDYLTQFLKLNKIAFTEQSRERWTNFVKECVEHPEAIPILAYVVKFYAENKLESNLINTDLRKLQLTTFKSSSITVLNQLFKNCTQAKQEFSSIQLEEKRNIINTWEQRIYEWENPAQFNTLWRDFQADILPLINQLKLDSPSGLSPTTEKSILNLALSLTDMMDATIKSLKSNSENLKQPTQLVERFVMILTSYNQLMANWVNAVPNESISNLFKEAAATGIRDELREPSIYKDTLIESVRSVLFKPNPTIAELTSSNDFSVASAQMGSSANFERQFIEKMGNITLEDLFSFMHQNILASINMIQQARFPINVATLPVQLQPLLSKTLTNDSKLSLLSIKHEFPIISLNYNLPMRNHSASFTFEYNQLTEKTILKGHFFGHNDSSRMDNLASLIKLDGEILDASEIQSPSYSNNSSSLNFSWELLKDNADTTATILLKNFTSYDYFLTNNHPIDSMNPQRIQHMLIAERIDLIKKIKNWEDATINLNIDDLNLPKLSSLMNEHFCEKELTFFIVKNIIDCLEDDDLKQFLDSIELFKNPRSEKEIRFLFDQIGKLGRSTKNTLILYLAENSVDYEKLHMVANENKYKVIFDAFKKFVPEKFSAIAINNTQSTKSAFQELRTESPIEYAIKPKGTGL